MDKEAWKQRWTKPKGRRKQEVEPLEHGGFILGEALAEKSTEEIRKLYAKELSQTSLDHRSIRV